VTLRLKTYNGGRVVSGRFAQPATPEVKKMPKQIEKKRVFSQPTMCLQCHLVVGMFHEPDADAWECPNCSHKYPFAHWKIKKQTRGKSKAA
jgi:ribosomal protein L37AE/L43A